MQRSCNLYIHLVLHSSIIMATIWNFFEVVTGDTKYAKCTICAAKISRGSAIPKNQTTAGLKKHLESKHLEAYKQ